MQVLQKQVKDLSLKTTLCPQGNPRQNAADDADTEDDAGEVKQAGD